jgi:predicted small metal-binding protein
MCGSKEEDAVKTLTCRDLGMECTFVASGETADEVKAKMLAHAQEAHADMLAGMSDQETNDLMRMMDEKMTTAA